MAEELLDSAMMTMRTTKAGEEKLDKHPSLYQQYLAKLKADARRLRAELSQETDGSIWPTFELAPADGPSMRSYAAADGGRMAQVLLRPVKHTN